MRQTEAVTTAETIDLSKKRLEKGSLDITLNKGASDQAQTEADKVVITGIKGFFNRMLLKAGLKKIL